MIEWQDIFFLGVFIMSFIALGWNPGNVEMGESPKTKRPTND